MDHDAATQYSPNGAQENGSIVEPRTKLDAGGTEEMFLTPRVLDAGAFARYAEALKGIIAQASSQGRTLEDFSADAEAMIKRCDETSDSVNKRLQAGIRMLKMIDERAERTDLLLDKAQQAMPDTEALSEQVDRMIEERLSASESRIERAIAQAEDRANAAERRALQATERSEEYAAEFEKLSRTIDGRLASLREVSNERSLSTESLRSQVDEARTQINETLARAFDRAHETGETLNTRAEQAIATMEARIERSGGSAEERLVAQQATIERGFVEREKELDGLRRQVNEARTQIDQVVAQAFEKANEAGQALSSRAEQTLGTMESRVERVNGSIGPMIETTERAIRALGMDPSNPVFEDSPMARIESLVERGETQLASLDRVYRQLEDLREQAEGVKSVFGSWLLDAAGQMDALEARKEQVVGPMSKAAETINRIGPDLDGKLELASTKLGHLQLEQQTLRTTIEASSALANQVSEDLSNQAGQLQALLDGSLNSLSTRVEQAGLWLGNLISRADSIGASLRGINRMEFGGEATGGTAGQALPESPFAAEGAAPEPVSQPAQQAMNTQTPAQAPEPMSMTPDQPIAQAVPEARTNPVTDPMSDQMNRAGSVNEPARTMPERLPIDTMSFDGSETVIEHQRPDDQSQTG